MRKRNNLYTRTHTHTHAHKHRYARTHTYTHVRTHTHTYTQNNLHWVVRITTTKPLVLCSLSFEEQMYNVQKHPRAHARACVTSIKAVCVRCSPVLCLLYVKCDTYSKTTCIVSYKSKKTTRTCCLPDLRVLRHINQHYVHLHVFSLFQETWNIQHEFSHLRL